MALSLAGLAALFILALSIGAPMPLPVATHAPRAITLFAFRRPAEPPPPPPPAPKADGGTRAAPKETPLDMPKPAPRPAVAPAPAILPVRPLVPLPTPPLAPAAADSGAKTAESGGTDGAGAGAGSGHGTGAGNGDGEGDGAEYAQAEWVERPPQDGIDHLWKDVAPGTVSTVSIRMVCRIVPPFKPRHCRILSEQPHVSQFGSTAIHLVELSRIRPIAKDGSPTDLPVIVGLTFNR